MFNFKKKYFVLSAVVLLIFLPLNAASGEKLTLLGQEIGGLTFDGVKATSKASLIQHLHKKGYILTQDTGNISFFHGKYLGVPSTIAVSTFFNSDKIQTILVMSDNFNNSKKLINDYNKFCNALKKEASVANIYPLPTKIDGGCTTINSKINILKLSTNELNKFKKVYGQSMGEKGSNDLLRILVAHWKQTNAELTNQVKEKIIEHAFLVLEDRHVKLYTVSLGFETSNGNLRTALIYKNNAIQ
ncbi:hypothetical protein [uncultured Anaerobiospirillum sp.]|uniref:hypothetical protein n=1 Tax=uncultured Anaerobiospirillum sp. TaxID=265728 RepID=UPI0028063B34|nr:hypothetical protein [uncultured Anaerobiospirillum sp.]